MSTVSLPVATASEIIREATARFHGLYLPLKAPTSHKYRHFALKRVRESHIELGELRKLAGHLGIEWISPPSSVPPTWIPSICEKFMSVKYTNPSNEEDYVVLISSRSVFGVKGVLRHTPRGYLDTVWFTDFVPILAEIYRDYQNALKDVPENLGIVERTKKTRLLMSININDPLNNKYKNGMKEEEIRSIHGLFKAYVPGVEGICKKCFKLQLPDSGLGESWRFRNSDENEIRLSIPKIDGREGQRVLYVTHQFMKGARPMFIKYEGIVREPEVKWASGPKSPTLSSEINIKETHIPWEIYDYHKTVSDLSKIEGGGLPICQCQKSMN